MALFAYRSASREGRLAGGKVPYRRAAKLPSARSRITIPSTTPASFGRPYAQNYRCLGERIAKFARETSSRRYEQPWKHGIGFIHTEIQSYGAQVGQHSVDVS
ncbi:hypothetical protein SNOG_00599 [Parastagonospora nodorum SN15]|uniref:Uncharacterized protein n=1 Tax=Phaeosphaeria nodorum (strain SN15 / ATCC MYA-4574 / FGSC 10173) TaxID=321614 RepID=Q0V5W5_PHANO|nr:hypothetical protein SNOG_00599 [Parastagonospora nodorum SN15]EAT92094.1 hypothetical protein SNOG_00599 [Parastagonospora nodorum SN15]